MATVGGIRDVEGSQSSLEMDSFARFAVDEHNKIEVSLSATVGGIRDVEGSQSSLEMDSLARFAVDEHNKIENALLEFGKVAWVKELVVAGTAYYITLEATNGGQRKVYDAKVWVKPWLDFKELQEFKFIADA
ncbi:cystatin B [Actinidia rufa]|uniref:Cysteine proteinase inhibitor n=1 Tax=Actinidia rufa TaxID=165716 RepID=A0A7J0HCM9_9ERIC|nr:cystatin B [Actinidia rufa]